MFSQRSGACDGSGKKEELQRVVQEITTNGGIAHSTVQGDHE